MRLGILDGMRGHLLIMMMLVHLAWQPGLGFFETVHHVRLIGLYDAEFLIVLSGFLVGLLTLTKLKDPLKLRSFLAVRVRKIYVYYLISALPFLVLTVFPIQNGGSDPKEAIWTVFEVLTIQNGGVYSDILPMYVFCFGLLLLATSVFRAHFLACLFLSSLLIYLISLPDFSSGFFGLGGKFMAFDVAGWQFLFFSSFVIGARADQIGQAITNLSPGVFLCLFVVTAGLVFLQRGYFVYPEIFAVPDGIADNWWRMQLHPAHMVRILIVCAFFALLLVGRSTWTLGISRAVNWYFTLRILRLPGVYAIQMFVLHVYLIALYQSLSVDLGVSSRVLFAGLLMAIFLIAPFALEQVSRLWRGRAGLVLSR